MKDRRKELPPRCKCKRIVNKDDPCNPLLFCKEQPLPLPPPQAPPPPSSTDVPIVYKESNVMITGVTIIGSMLLSALLLGFFYALTRFYYNRRNNSRRRSSPIIFGTRDDFPDEDVEPHFHNPRWYINSSVGLQQSVIDSITVFKYRKDEGLIEGTECSVCLNEFQEDESLRLLPKCSHAFHLPCIDIWLRSHKNCPLCRAPVVCETMVAQASASEPNSIDSGSRNEALVENSENYGVGHGRNDVGEGGTIELRTCPIEDGNTSENSKKSSVHSKTRSSDSGSDSQISSDFAGVQHDAQPMKRSFSLDLSSAMKNYNDVAGLTTAAHKHHGSLDTELQKLKHPKGKIVLKRSSGSPSICKLMKSSSIGRSLSKGPISMKRSFSSGGKFLLSKRSRSQDSILPL